MIQDFVDDCGTFNQRDDLAAPATAPCQHVKRAPAVHGLCPGAKLAGGPRVTTIYILGCARHDVIAPKVPIRIADLPQQAGVWPEGQQREPKFTPFCKTKCPQMALEAR
ncbi:MAG: hypothetical protein KC502_08680 [Myxococcales bacterium]|nr:hypothetical protein [Myxococcales bacterium]